MAGGYARMRHLRRPLVCLAIRWRRQYYQRRRSRADPMYLRRLHQNRLTKGLPLYWCLGLHCRRLRRRVKGLF